MQHRTQVKSVLSNLPKDSVELPELLACFEKLQLSSSQSLFIICDLQQLFELKKLSFSKDSLKSFEERLDARLKPTEDFDDDFEAAPKDPKNKQDFDEDFESDKKEPNKKDEFDDDFVDVKKDHLDLDFKDPLDDYNF